jgi:hypothetical protein
MQTILLPSLKVSYGVIANSKVSQKQDKSSDLQDKIILPLQAGLILSE